MTIYSVKTLDHSVGYALRASSYISSFLVAMHKLILSKQALNYTRGTFRMKKALLASLLAVGFLSVTSIVNLGSAADGAEPASSRTNSLSTAMLYDPLRGYFRQIN
jgi:hypothetical protein